MSPSAKPSVNSERRVKRAIQRARDNGTEVTVAAIARAAKVDRTFLYRRPDLLAGIQAGQETALADEDKNAKTYPVKLSDNVIALIDEARGEMPRAQWLRTAALEKLARDTGIPVEALDGGRRAAPRRRNYSERAAAQDKQREEGQER